MADAVPSLLPPCGSLGPVVESGEKVAQDQAFLSGKGMPMTDSVTLRASPTPASVSSCVTSEA